MNWDYSHIILFYINVLDVNKQIEGNVLTEFQILDFTCYARMPTPIPLLKIIYPENNFQLLLLIVLL